MIPLVAATGNIISDSMDRGNIKYMTAGDKSIKIVFYLGCPETLAAVYDFIKVHIISDIDMHDDSL